MKIGFARGEITPPVGTELGGYAGFRPCTGAHDPLFCKAVVLEQDGERYGLLAMDLMCVDEALHLQIADAVADLGLTRERLIISAIHSHSSPSGLIIGEGPLSEVNRAIEPVDTAFPAYMTSVVQTAAAACAQAAENLEPFRVRSARGVLPPVGSERHTGAEPAGELTVLQFHTQSGRDLIIYNFPCHPTVMSPANLLASADFAADIEGLLGADMAVFLNGAAGDISTRFTRRESTFDECSRMARIAAEQITSLISQADDFAPTPLVGLHTRIELQPREVESVETAQRILEEHTARWKQAEAQGAEPSVQRTLKSYVEGAGVNLEFSRSMRGIRTLRLPVSVFRFAGLNFAAIPGELFSTLLPPQQLAVICYANGYYRYIADQGAYDAGYYEALAAIVARGGGEYLMEQVIKLLRRLDDT